MQRVIAALVGITLAMAAKPSLASECDTPQAAWLFCEDFEKGGLGWADWFAQSPFVECIGCNSSGNNPARIQLLDDSAQAHEGRWSLYMPAEASANYQGAALAFRSCAGEKRSGCSLTGYEQLYYRAWVRLADDHDYVHHFMSVGGTRPDAYWEGDGNAGCRPNGVRAAGTTVDFKNSELFFYTYYPEMNCDSGGYCDDRQPAICDGCAAKDMPCSNGPECCWGNHFSADPKPLLPKSRWVCLEMTMKLNSVGQSDGEMAFWIDGQLGHQQGGMHWRDVSELQLNKVWVQHYIDVGDTDHSNRIWWDDIVVSTERIGCGTAPPSADSGSLPLDAGGTPAPDGAVASADGGATPVDANASDPDLPSSPAGDGRPGNGADAALDGGCSVAPDAPAASFAFIFALLALLLVRRGRARRNVIATLAILLITCPMAAHAAPLSLDTAQKDARQALGARLPDAKLLWVRGGKVYFSRLDDFAPQLVTTDNTEETNPRWSPDGSKILTVRPDGVYVMQADLTGGKLVMPGAHTASWTADGRAITAVDATGFKVLQHDLASGGASTLYDAQQAPYNGEKVSQAAELRAGGRFLLVFRLTPTHVTEIVDLQNKTYIANDEMLRGDCSPAWAPDGSYILNTARTGSRPVLRATFDASGASISPSEHFVGLATSEKFYIHGQRHSNDGRWVAFGGVIFAGEAANGAREIYLWRAGESEESAVRLTFDSDEDESPSLFIPTPAPADGSAPNLDGSIPPTPASDAGADNPSPDDDGSSPGPATQDASPATSGDGANNVGASNGSLGGGCSAVGAPHTAHFFGAGVLLLLILLRQRG